MTANPPLTGTAPAPRVRVEGTVTTVHADGRFSLALPDGAEAFGRSSGSQLQRLGKFVGHGVIVLGTGATDGTLDADGVLPVQGPFILGACDVPLSTSEAAESAARFASTIGMWPGDESDEQLDALLRDDR
ncbi:hypothetical protein [Gemmata sp.]|uniref:hypothetical protein n=1 Tax=Gemmata sp. TaxID=1914242 RepID=UPI003F6E78A4